MANMNSKGRPIIQRARGKDMMNLRIYFDYLYPPQKAIASRLNSPTKQTDDGAQGYEAVLNGSITRDEASTIAIVLEAKHKAIETIEITKIVSVLEYTK